MDMAFSEFMHHVLKVICYIYLMLMPYPQILIVHNSDDLTSRFADAEYSWERLQQEAISAGLRRDLNDRGGPPERRTQTKRGMG